MYEVLSKLHNQSSKQSWGEMEFVVLSRLFHSRIMWMKGIQKRVDSRGRKGNERMNEGKDGRIEADEFGKTCFGSTWQDKVRNQVVVLETEV